MANMKVFQFGYTSCIHESVMACMSLHRTRKGAEMAMEFHKEKERKEWEECYPTKEEQEDHPFGKHEAWGVFEKEIVE